MATWFRFPKALIGVSNKAGSSTLRRMASGKYKEFMPVDARREALAQNLPSFLILRDPCERAESAFNYFESLGWPRLLPRGFSDIHAFYRHLQDFPPARMDPHWAPQKLQHSVHGKEWWDYEVPFEVACRDLFDEWENKTVNHRPQQRFTLSERCELLDGVYHLDLALPPKRIEYLASQLTR